MTATELEQVIVGCSTTIRRLRECVLRIGPTHTPVLLQGPSGVGKEVVARAIHAASARRGKFVPANVNAFQPALFESEMFGHVRGAFSGAVRDREGMLRRADGGTAFLDEVGELPAALQAKLLRAVETRDVWPVGSDHKYHADFRLIAATNVDLAERVRDGRFRLDLFHRLGGRMLVIAPLNERLEDVPLLVDHLLARVAPEYVATHGTIARCAMELLKRYPWPGNVRQLSNVLESAVTEASGGRVTEIHVREVLIGGDTATLPQQAYSKETDYLRAKLLDLVGTHQGDAEAIAVAMGVSRATIYRHLRRLGVRTGKRKVWSLPDDRPATNEPDKISIISHVSPTTENF
ncbi:MAG TPA: sigma 54-interacting transcriptional regulator [Gemmatimonadaceae bacterium]|nr:sigma 54-interacting transcriptional regulator [Gemmatimonadaceae bacterium]